MKSRKYQYAKRTEKLLKHCRKCRRSKYPPSIERCDSCSIGRKLRMLEVEYSDITGWSHSKWK